MGSASDGTKSGFPKAYVDSAQQDDKTMIYVNGGDFAHMGIGARSSGQPKGGDAPTQIKSIDHVGSTATGKGK
jgi:hypothetical protein